MEVVKIDKLAYDTSIIIKDKVGDVSHLYDVRVTNSNGVIDVKSVGKRTTRQRNFKYLDYMMGDDYTYRRMVGDEKAKYFKKKLLEYVPAYVINKAIREFVNNLDIRWLEVEDDDLRPNG